HEGRVSVRKREAVQAPRFGVWINLSALNVSAADLKPFALPNANYLVTNARLGATAPHLFVNRSVTLTGDLPAGESTAPKFFPQSLTGMAFVTPSLRRSARFWGRTLYMVADRRWSALLFSRSERVHHLASFTSNFRKAANTAGR